MTLVGATVASVWGDIFHHPDDEAVLDNTLAYVRWMHSEWDTVSGCKKGHMTWSPTYICCGCPHDKPRLNIEVSARAARNVRFIASSARAGEHLMCSPCEQDCPSRESYIPRHPGRRTGIQARYLILVVPGARLGSVSLASVWKCSV